MRFLILAATLVVAPTVVAEQTQPSDRNLHVGLFGYRPDGTVSAHAVQTQLARRSFVWISESGCGVGTGPDTSEFKPLYAWSLSGKVLELTVATAVIELDWQRVIDNGHPAVGPGGSVQLTLNAGDRVLVDSVVPHMISGQCWTSVGLEARYRADPLFFADTQVTGTPRRGTVSGGGMSLPRIESSGEFRRSGGSGGSGRPSDAAAPGTAVTTSSYAVHLWLVRAAPGRPEESQYRHVNVSKTRSSFSFAPLIVETSRGPVNVTVGGSLERVGTEGGHLILLLHRDVPQWDGGKIYSESKIKILPRPDEVASVDMPPFRIGDQLFPDRLSLRVSVEPR